MSPQPRKDLIGAAVDGVIRFCLENKLIVFLLLIAVVVWGVIVMPFDYEIKRLPRDPVPVDAIPDIGENQQIVFTEWPGRSPQDVEDQVTYPLTVSLLGVPGVKTIRSYSYLGFSSVYVVFKEDVDFYWSRSRILEQLNVAQKELPADVTPALGPDATALGQIFWYTLEGRDPQTDEPTGGWDLEQLRSIQDWQVRYALQSVEGVSEVASVGGFVREYQVDVDPDAMRAFDVTLTDIYDAVRGSNIDVGARTIEINRVEYVIRGLGFLKSVADLQNTMIKTRDNVPVTIDNVAHVSLGPAMRRGVLDKGGAEAVGGVVVVRYGENPLEVIKRVKQKIREIEPGLPQLTLADGRISQVRIVPFYDRTQLIHETLDTLSNALTEEIMVTIIVVIVMVMHLRSSLLISALLPLAVMMTFIAMKVAGVDSNIMSLSGIAIAIGTMVDMGVILSENMLKHLDEADERESRMSVIFRAASEVGRPVLTAILTTVVSFLPVFTMVGPAGKLFKPLAYTKSFALIASVIVALTLIPPIAHLLFSLRIPRGTWRRVGGAALVAVGLAMLTLKLTLGWPLFWASLVLLLLGVYLVVRDFVPPRFQLWLPRVGNAVAIIVVLFALTGHWMPLGPEPGFVRNLLFIALAIAGLLAVFLVFLKYYEPLLRFFLNHKLTFYALPLTSVLLGLVIWKGFDRIFIFVPRATTAVGIPERWVRGNALWVWAAHEFPGLGKEFMPSLDEGSFLYMPTTMPHASIGEATDVLSKQDMAISAIPEVASVVGKIGRVESPLDPAPISMVETIVNYRPEYDLDDRGRPMRYRFDRQAAEFVRDGGGNLIEDPRGRPYRNWRPHIRSSDDIWQEIEQAAQMPGSTSAPKLQPIAARIVMLQTGVRAPMAVRILGQNLKDIERLGLDIERLLKSKPLEAQGVEPATVFADRIVGKPYLEIDIDRAAIARYGVNIRAVQDVIETAIGGQRITTTVEGRQRYPVRVRYQRELRDTIESLGRILVAGSGEMQVPLEQVATINFVRGPQVVRSEDTRYVGYVIFDKRPGFAEVDVVEACRRRLDQAIESGELALPTGTERPTFIGSYENQVRSEKTLRVVLPLALFIIFIILYLQFRSVPTTLLIFVGVFIACSGGMLLIWFYSTDWFLNFSIFSVNMRDLFQVRPLNLSVAVWVGFIALLGIATDDGVVVASYLNQSFAEKKPGSIAAIRNATVAAGLRRIRPCLMTTATTILALLPVLTSTGRGSDVMVPMAIPSFGGMLIALMTLFFVPVSYCWIAEWKLKHISNGGAEERV
ncbi:MAG: efflux RND transporter permease subunit [Planctomycetota bacterium]|nr:efflux RND transporter permease subunit [Planctomycetota bacterium]